MRTKLHRRIKWNQDVSVQRFESQAKRMNYPLKKGKTVTNPLPDSDRIKGEPQNLIDKSHITINWRTGNSLC